MAKKFVAIVITLLLMVPLFLVVANNITENEIIMFSNGITDNSNSIYNSSRFTGVDDFSENPSQGVALRLEKDANPEDRNNGDYDELVITKGDSSLYFNQYLNIFKVKNNITGYLWSTGQDQFSADDASAVVARFLSSTIVLGYYVYNATNDTYGNDIRLIYLTTAVKEETSYKLGQNSEVTVTTSSITSGMKLTLYYNKLGFRFNAYITLDDEGALDIRIPNEEIEEKLNDSQHLIATIRFAGGIGANVDGTEPGYLVIPDGSGALIRYGEKTMNSQQYLHYYGNDRGINPSISNWDTKNLTMPIYGFVNGIKQDACLAIIEEGAFACDLIVGLNGTNSSRYNYMAPSFQLRSSYLLYGINQTTQLSKTGSDFAVHYEFLSNDDATYIGIANSYQDYLVENEMLTKTTDGTYRLRLDTLLSESVKALIGTKNVTMTSLDELKDIIKDLNSVDIDDLLLVMLGWNKSGLSLYGTTPYEIKYNSKVGSKREFKNFINEQTKNGNEVYFYNDYVIGGQNGDYSTRTDIARSIQRLRLTYKNSEIVYNELSYLYPKSSYELAKDNLKKYDKLDMNSLALDSIGSTLFTTYYKEKISGRDDSADYYQRIAELFNNEDFRLAMYSPSAYMWTYLDAYLDTPLYPNQYIFYTDTIPLVAYTLRGVVDYYAPYTNFFANQTEQVLRSLDFGALPSYIITSGESRELKYTNSNQLITTVYDHWSETMKNYYSLLKPGYLAISDARVVDRTVVQSGLVQIEYSNGTIIQIDYLNAKYRVEGGISEWITLAE